MPEGNAPDLGHRVRAKLDAGFLPFEKAEKTFAGYGTGLRCHGCDDPIGPSQIEYEKVFADGATFLFHSGCAGLYEGERLRGIEPQTSQRDACAICGRRFGTSDLIEFSGVGSFSVPVHMACAADRRRGPR